MFSFKPLTLFIAVWFLVCCRDSNPQLHSHPKSTKKTQTAVCDSDLHLNTRIVIT